MTRNSYSYFSNRRNPNVRYYVTGHNADTIMLKRAILPGTAVAIPRATIASIAQTLGVIRVETTGGHVYEVYPGLRRTQRAKTVEAFGADRVPNIRVNWKPEKAEVTGWGEKAPLTDDTAPNWAAALKHGVEDRH